MLDHPLPVRPAEGQVRPGYHAGGSGYVLEEIELHESRRQACESLASKLSVNASTLYGWVKLNRPGFRGAAMASPGADSTAWTRSWAALWLGTGGTLPSVSKVTIYHNPN